MALCATCLNCINGTEEKLEAGIFETARFHHHRHISGLRAAAHEQCPICSTAWEKFSDLYSTRTEMLELLDQCDSFLECGIVKEDRFTILLWYPKRAGDILELNPGQASHLCHSVEFVLSENFDNASFGQPSSLSTCSDEAWQLVSSWAEDCVSKHVTCNEENSMDWYPTRLLDVAPVSSDSDRIRIVLPDKDNVRGPYVTLSHCWGEGEFLKLLKSSTTELRSGFSAAILPKSFYEAVVTTRRLNIRYLWIDSLCIVQDDKDDWLREAVLMYKVYTHAFCNIAATASTNSSGGLFRERVPTELHRVEYDLSFPGVEEEKPVERYSNLQSVYYWFQDWFSGDVKKDESIKRYTLLQGAYWPRELDQSPLNCRAWVMQERLLSRRILHFTRKEIVWECREHAACESYPRGFPTKVKTFSSFKTPFFTQGSGINPNDVLSRGFWHDIQNSYGTCKLSVPSDRLIAISGIARKLQAITGDEYVAGMWRKNLALDILWNIVGYTYKRPAHPTPLTDYDVRFPSFSWASTPLRTRIGWREDMELECPIRVSDVRIESEHDALSGIIQSGSLHLHGRLKTAWLHYEDIPDSTWYKWAMFVSNTKEMENAVKITDYIFLDRPDLAFQTFGKQEPVFFMPAIRYQAVLCDCLLLQLIDHDKATFRRIGLARALSGELFDQLVASQEDEHLLPCLSYTSDTEYSHEILLV